MRVAESRVEERGRGMGAIERVFDERVFDGRARKGSFSPELLSAAAPTLLGSYELENICQIVSFCLFFGGVVGCP